MNVTETLPTDQARNAFRSRKEKDDGRIRRHESDGSAAQLARIPKLCVIGGDT